MRNLIIILLWVALGYWYYTVSRTSCPDRTIPDRTGQVDEVIKETSKISGTSTNYKFLKSTVVLSENDQQSLGTVLPLQENKGLEIIGYAYSNENDPHQLALLRAKEIQIKLGLSSNQVRLIGVIMEEDYAASNDFISYTSYNLTQEEVTDVGNNKFNGILREGKKVLFYIDSYDSKSGFSTPIRSELRRVVAMLSNNFCKIVLVSYNDDMGKGKELAYQFEEQLIKSGLSPARITYESQKQGDRNTSIVELRIVE